MTIKPIPSNFENPFTPETREELWAKIRKNAKPISKEELFKRVEEIKKAGKNKEE